MPGPEWGEKTRKALERQASYTQIKFIAEFSRSAYCKREDKLVRLREVGVTGRVCNKRWYYAAECTNG